MTTHKQPPAMDIGIWRTDSGFLAGPVGHWRQETPYWLHANPIPPGQKRSTGGASLILMGVKARSVLMTLASFRRHLESVGFAANGDSQTSVFEGDGAAVIWSPQKQKGQVLMQILANTEGMLIDHASGDAYPMSMGLTLHESVWRTLVCQASWSLDGRLFQRDVLLRGSQFHWIFSENDTSQWGAKDVALLASDVRSLIAPADFLSSAKATEV